GGPRGRAAAQELGSARRCWARRCARPCQSYQEAFVGGGPLLLAHRRAGGPGGDLEALAMVGMGRHRTDSSGWRVGEVWWKFVRSERKGAKPLHRPLVAHTVAHTVEQWST